MTNHTLISAKELHSLRESGDIIVVDIREIDEYNREHIPGAHCLPFSTLNAETLNTYTKQGVPIVFHCHSGNRTKQAENTIAESEFDQVYLLDGGITAWKKHGGETNCCKKAPLPLMRQIQIIVGSMVLLGIILGFIFSSLFTLISAFFGAGLLFAGITGYCGLANMLQLLPYNKRTRQGP